MAENHTHTLSESTHTFSGIWNTASYTVSWGDSFSTTWSNAEKFTHNTNKKLKYNKFLDSIPGFSNPFDQPPDPYDIVFSL